ncbi:MAG: type II toxin-antitoxin system RelE/ParE family toxin [Hyphomonas sp.]
MKIDFSLAAEADIAAINREGIRLFGLRQAEKYSHDMAKAFRLIADYPLASPVRDGFERPIRIRPFGAHVVLYELRDDVALILRIRHGHEDWTADY